MVCTAIGPNVIVCGPAQVYRRFYGLCEVCKRRRRMVRRFDGIHYGNTEGCYTCGTFWSDGQECDRDRERAVEWWFDAIPPGEFDAGVRRVEKAWTEAWSA